MNTFNEIEDLFVSDAFDNGPRIDELVDAKRKLIDDQKHFKYTVSTNLNTNKYIEEVMEYYIGPTDLQKAVYEAILKELEDDSYHDHTGAYRYDNHENIY